MQSSHPMECICHCTIAYTGRSRECSAGEDNNDNKSRDPTHAILSPYGMYVHVQLHIPDGTDSVELENATTTAAVSEDDLHAFGPVCALVVPLKGLQMVPSQLGEGVHHVGAQKGIDILRNKSVMSGSVLGPVRVVAHASTAA